MEGRDNNPSLFPFASEEAAAERGLNKLSEELGLEQRSDRNPMCGPNVFT